MYAEYMNKVCCLQAGPILMKKFFAYVKMAHAFLAHSLDKQGCAEYVVKCRMFSL